jgi:PLP dependent protein
MFLSEPVFLFANFASSLKHLAMDIVRNLNTLLKAIPSHVTLVAVTKMHKVEEIMQVYNAGYKVFGENKVQELGKKRLQIPDDVEWHLIGHLQTNKIRSVIPYVHLIHSIDSVHLLEAVNEEALKQGKTINCLLQIHIATEETKFGFSEEELYQAFESDAFSKLQNVRLCGLMGMATFTVDQTQIRREFHQLADLFQKVKSTVMKNNPFFKELSMGMSSDFAIAIEEGSTMIRIGSAIFGERNYDR